MVALSIIMIDETRRRPGAPVLSSFVFLDRTRFENLERLAEVDFDQSVNASLRLQASIVLAETVGVPGARILGTTGDLDTLMTK